MAHGMDDLRLLPLERFSHFVWWMLTRNADETETNKLRAKVWRPPLDLKGPIDPRSPWSPENEARAFSALKMQTTGQGPTRTAPQGQDADTPKKIPKLANGESAF